MEIKFGIWAPPFGKQIGKQKLNFDKDIVRQFQMDSNAISRLRIRGLVSDSYADTLRSKLYRKIVSHVKSQNKK